MLRSTAIDVTNYLAHLSPADALLHTPDTPLFRHRVARYLSGYGCRFTDKYSGHNGRTGAATRLPGRDAASLGAAGWPQEITSMPVTYARGGSAGDNPVVKLLEPREEDCHRQNS